jgi:glycerol-3-phosphate O-acyltransferase/dihydroxyacetone phosphate acyltransferase
MASKGEHIPETGVRPEDARSHHHPKELYPMSKWKYDSFLWVMSIFADTFFREVHPRGSWKVPRHGPVLFVAAPHANQVNTELHIPEILPRIPCRTYR